MIEIFELKDGVKVEVEIDENVSRNISCSKKIDASIEDIGGVLLKVVKPISKTYKELNKDINISETKVVLGMKFGIEGGFVLAKSTVEAHIQVEMTMRDENE